MDIPKMNLLFIIVVILQICIEVNSHPSWDPYWATSQSPVPGYFRDPTQGTFIDPSWSSPLRFTVSTYSGPAQSNIRGSSRSFHGTCNCNLYETCAMVRDGNALPQMGCINTPIYPHIYNTGRRASGVHPGDVGYAPESNASIQGRASIIREDEYGIHYLFYKQGASTGVRVNITKTGFCSRVPATRSLQACAPSCSSDTDCSGARKCCPNGCSIGCVAPRGSVRGSGDLQISEINTNPVTSSTGFLVGMLCARCQQHPQNVPCIIRFCVNTSNV